MRRSRSSSRTATTGFRASIEQAVASNAHRTSGIGGIGVCRQGLSRESRSLFAVKPCAILRSCFVGKPLRCGEMSELAEGARLEIVYAPKAYPGFESPSLRQRKTRGKPALSIEEHAGTRRDSGPRGENSPAGCSRPSPEGEALRIRAANARNPRLSARGRRAESLRFR